MSARPKSRVRHGHPPPSITIGDLDRVAVGVADVDGRDGAGGVPDGLLPSRGLVFAERFRARPVADFHLDASRRKPATSSEVDARMAVRSAIQAVHDASYSFDTPTEKCTKLLLQEEN